MHYEKRAGLKPVPYPTTPDGKIVWLEESEREAISKSILSLQDVQNRLDNGWKVQDAISLNNKYEMHNGEIHYVYRTERREELIHIDRMHEAEIEKGIIPRTVAKRLNRGLSVEEALTLSPSTSDNASIARDIEEQKIKQRKREERRQQAVKSMKVRKFKEEKPHLYDGTEQNHTRGEYTTYLMENDVFPKREVAK